MEKKKEDAKPQTKIDLKTVDIKGKQYVQVHERIRIFRQDARYEGWALITSPVQVTDEVAFFEAKIFNKENVLVANGHAREVKQASYINKTSYIENAETSAMGRALGNIGIGVETSFCTADELLIAMQAQNEAAQQTKPTNAFKGPAPKEHQVQAPKAVTISQEQIDKIRDLEIALDAPAANVTLFKSLDDAKKYYMALLNELKKREGAENA